MRISYRQKKRGSASAIWQEVRRGSMVFLPRGHLVPQRWSAVLVESDMPSGGGIGGDSRKEKNHNR